MRTLHILLISMMMPLCLLGACGGEKPAPSGAPAPAPETVTRDASIVAPVGETVAEDSFVIVMLGDSLTAGFGLAADEALPEQVALLLEGRGYNITMINAGVSGDTSAGGLARYDWSVGAAKPDLLIVALGANDFLNRIPAASTRANLTAIIERALSEGIDVALMGVSAGDAAQNNPGIAEYTDIYPSLAAQFDVPLFADMLGGVRNDFNLMQLDGLHPTRAGVKIMAARMVTFLVPYLPEDIQSP